MSLLFIQNNYKQSTTAYVLFMKYETLLTLVSRYITWLHIKLG